LRPRLANEGRRRIGGLHLDKRQVAESGQRRAIASGGAMKVDLVPGRQQLTKTAHRLGQVAPLVGRIEVEHRRVHHGELAELAVRAVLQVIDAEVRTAHVGLQRQQRRRPRLGPDTVDVLGRHRTGADHQIVANLIPVQRPFPHGGGSPLSR
jgi:hypothetical protein